MSLPSGEEKNKGVCDKYSTENNHGIPDSAIKPNFKIHRASCDDSPAFS
jgi:hypothetical protein